MAGGSPLTRSAAAPRSPAGQGSGAPRRKRRWEAGHTSPRAQGLTGRSGCTDEPWLGRGLPGRASAPRGRRRDSASCGGPAVPWCTGPAGGGRAGGDPSPLPPTGPGAQAEDPAPLSSVLAGPLRVIGVTGLTGEVTPLSCPSVALGPLSTASRGQRSRVSLRPAPSPPSQRPRPLPALQDMGLCLRRSEPRTGSVGATWGPWDRAQESLCVTGTRALSFCHLPAPPRVTLVTPQ